MKKLSIYFVTAILCAALMSTAANAQTNEFTYQGSLKDGANPANGDYDLQFGLFSVSTGGSPIGTRTRVVGVVNGAFSVRLDFAPSAFNGFDRWIEVGVRPAGSPNPYTTLLPRQPVTHVPYAFRSIQANDADTAGTANNALQLGGVAANQYVLTDDPRMSDARPPISSSGFYIQNRTIGQQTAASFNITGNGYVGGTFHATGAINTVTQYNLAGSRILGTGPSDSLFVGLGAGANNTNNGTIDGTNNTFVGRDAGNANTFGYFNSFFGARAGLVNTNIFNSFFGFAAGEANTTGPFNAFFGAEAGGKNTNGAQSSYFGFEAGRENTSGDNNAFFGFRAGEINTTGSNNTAIGKDADFGSGNLTYATVIGADATVSTSNTIQLGRTDGSDTVLVPGRLEVGTLGAGGVTLCRNANNRLSDCVSSLRYKTNVETFTGGMDLVRRLRPVTFNWKEGGAADVGFAAEEVAEIEPLLATYMKDGQIQGVKYAQITTVLVNAVKEQQAQIEAQAKEINEQKATMKDLQVEIGLLKAYICLQTPTAAICKSQN